MAKQTFTTGQVLTAAQMTALQQTAMLGGAASAKTASYVLVAADAGDAITMSNAGATTITVNTGLFATGDIVTIINIGVGVCTITAGTATVTTSGSLALAQNQGGVLRFTSASAAIFLQFATPASGDIEGVTAGTGISGGGTSGTVTITNSMATAMTTKGDLIVATGSGAFVRQGVGSNNQVLMADSVEADGVKYANEATATLTTTGDTLYASAANTLARRAIGSTGQVLTVSGGVPTWVTPSTGGLAISEIATGTPSGSSLSITGLSNYDQIDFFVYSLTHTINDNLLFRINSNTGGNYAQAVMIQKGSTTDFTRGTAETSFLLTPNDAKGATQSNHVLWVRLTNCKSTGFTSAEYNHYYRDSAGGGYINMQTGTYKVAEAVSSIQLVVASGSFNGGTYVVYAG